MLAICWLFYQRSPLQIILAQLLKLNGASKVVIAANEGIKMKIARECDAADEYWDLKRGDAAAQWAELKEAHPYVLAWCNARARLLDR